MAKFSHKNADVRVDSEDISGDTNDCTLTIDVGVSEVTCFQDDWDAYVKDIIGWSLSLAGFTNQDASEVEAVLFGFVDPAVDEVALIYHPQGTTAGYKFTGDVILTGMSVGGPVKGGCPYSASFQGTGELSRSSFGL